MVGHFSSLALAASALGNGIFYGVLFALNGFTFGLKPPVAEADAQNKPERVADLLAHGLLFFSGLCLITLLFFKVFVSNLEYILFMQPPDVIAEAKPYMMWLAWSCVPHIMYHCLEQFVEGLSRTKISMVANVIGNVVHFALNYLLIFGHWGFPELGLVGAGVSTLVSRFVIFLTFLLYIVWDKDLSIYVGIIRKSFRLDTSYFKLLLSLGLPIALQMFFEVTAFTACMLMSGNIGKIELAAHQIVLNISILTYLVAASFGQSSTIVLARLAAQSQTVHQAGRIALAWVLFLMLVFGVLIMVFKTWVPLLYLSTDDPNFETIRLMAAGLMFIVALYQIADGAQVLLMGILRGLQDVRMPTYLVLFAYWVIGIPSAYVFAFVLNGGIEGVWWGLCLGLFVSALLLVMRAEKLYRKRGL